MPMDVYHTHIINTMYQIPGSAYFSLFLFYLSADNVKKLEHLDAAFTRSINHALYELIRLPPDSPLKLIQIQTSQTLK